MKLVTVQDIYFFFSVLISATHVFSSPLLLLLSFLHFIPQISAFLKSHTLASQTELKTQSSLISQSARQLPPFFFQTLIPPNKEQFFPLNLRLSLSPNHFYLLFLLSISHIMFLPNPNPAEKLVMFPSQSQIFRHIIFLFSFALRHIIFFSIP